LKNIVCCAAIPFSWFLVWSTPALESTSRDIANWIRFPCILRVLPRVANVACFLIQQLEASGGGERVPLSSLTGITHLLFLNRSLCSFLLNLIVTTDIIGKFSAQLSNGPRPRQCSVWAMGSDPKVGSITGGSHLMHVSAILGTRWDRVWEGKFSGILDSWSTRRRCARPLRW